MSSLETLQHSKLLTYKCADDKDVSLVIGVWNGNLSYTVFGKNGVLLKLPIAITTANTFANIWKIQLKAILPDKAAVINIDKRDDEGKMQPLATITHGYNENKNPYIKLSNAVTKTSWLFNMRGTYGYRIVTDEDNVVLTRSVIETYTTTITNVAEVRKALSSFKTDNNKGGNGGRNNNYNRNNNGGNRDDEDVM